MKLKVEIEMDNAAFSENGSGTEVARILQALAKKVDGQDLDESFGTRLMDVNGNKVGTADVEA